MHMYIVKKIHHDHRVLIVKGFACIMAIGISLGVLILTIGIQGTQGILYNQLASTANQFCNELSFISIR